MKKITPEYDFDLYFGKNPEDYFDEARIANAERAYDRVIEQSQEHMDKHMVEMIGEMIKNLDNLKEGEVCDAVIDGIYAEAFSIKCNAGMYGYPLATAFAKQLFYYCKEVHSKPVSVTMKACISAHLGALKVIFMHNIRSMSDPIAQELLKELERISEIS